MAMKKDKRESAWGAGRVERARRREEILFGIGKCWMGKVLVGVSEWGVVAVLVGKAEGTLVAELQDRFEGDRVVRNQEACAAEVAEVARFIDAPRGDLALELDIRGTPFQKKVWREVRKIPFGEVRSYSEIAERIGAGRAVRAVGSACTRVPLVVLIPCHRVVRKGGGSAAGFSGGSARQHAMLRREGWE